MAERGRILVRAMESETGRRKSWASFALAMPVATIPAWLLADLSSGISSPWLRGALHAAMFFLVAFIALDLLYPWFNDRILRREICEAMRVHGFEVCAECGYPMRHVEGDDGTCPECGADRADLTCQKCGHILRGTGGPIERCPECGTDQKAVLQRPRRWWRELKFVDNTIDVGNTTAWRDYRRQARSRAIGPAAHLQPGLTI